MNESTTWLVEVRVNPKAGVNDPVGEAIRLGLSTLGYDNVSAVAAGRLFTLTVEAPGADAAVRQTTEMAEKLLANTVIESFDVRVVDGLGAARTKRVTA